MIRNVHVPVCEARLTRISHSNYLSNETTNGTTTYIKHSQEPVTVLGKRSHDFVSYQITNNLVHSFCCYCSDQCCTVSVQMSFGVCVGVFPPRTGVVHCRKSVFGTTKQFSQVVIPTHIPEVFHLWYFQVFKFLATLNSVDLLFSLSLTCEHCCATYCLSAQLSCEAAGLRLQISFRFYIFLLKNVTWFCLFLFF